MIVVYNARGEIQYSVDDPYPAAMYDTYEARKDVDPEFFYTVVEQTSISDKYVDTSDGAVIDRPTMSIRLPASVDIGGKIDLSGVPKGCSIFIDGQEMICKEENVTLTADEPGIYALRFRCWPFVDFIHEMVVS